MNWDRIAPLIGLGVTALISCGAELPAAATGPAWRTDFASAREEARRARKLLFVVFRCQP